MDHIETKILNSYTIQEAAQNMVFAARLTQQGHSIQNMWNYTTNTKMYFSFVYLPIALLEQNYIPSYYSHFFSIRYVFHDFMQ